MVENSLGRFWLESHPNKELQEKWKYYVEEAPQEEDVKLKLNQIRNDNINIKPEDIKVIDPCMGSGHILVYVFDVLMDIYISEGYTEKDATISILENNIYGLDIDDRAYQLSYFALMMKARTYHRRIFNKNIELNISSIKESNEINPNLIKYLLAKNPKIEFNLLQIIHYFKDAKNYGSMLIMDDLNITNLNNILICLDNNKRDLFNYAHNDEINLLKSIIKQVKILKTKYDVVITNPPYMGNSNMNSELKEYIKSNYPLSKTDLFSVFIEKGFKMIKKNGFNCMVTMQSWMFLSSFEKLRNKIIKNATLINLLHMDNMVMRIAFGTSATIFRKTNLDNYNGTYFHVKLSDVNNENIVNPMFFNDKNKFITQSKKFNKIPGKPIAYWFSENIIKTFDNGVSISNISDFTGSQNITANNNKYIRFFWEINNNLLGSKWVKYAKGGAYKKYYGNIYLVVDWSHEARNFYENNKTSNLLDKKLWFKKGITYTAVSSRGTGFRYLPENCIFDKGGPSIVNIKYLYYCLGLLNTNIAEFYLNLFNPTLNIQVKDIKRIPIILSDFKDEIEKLTLENVKLTKEDWDEKEISFDFKKNFLLNKFNTLQKSYEFWLNRFNFRFNKVKENQIELNKKFIEIYNLYDEISFDVSDDEVTLYKPSLNEVIKSFVSYAVGCMFGRYSLDEEGLQFAGGEFDISKYHKFVPDEDNIIPILDTEYFEDDIVGRFVEFVKVCFGKENLEENLDFIAGGLNKKGKNSREIIRKYFLKDFFKDHAKTYKKCPIYWQFDSGKQDGFKCLIYMHRYNPNLLSKIRTDYLHKTQRAIEESITNYTNIKENSELKSEVKEATKALNKLNKQLDETKKYDEVLGHLANQKIEIDLDDGVKVNYAKFQNIQTSNNNKKQNLLKEI